MPQTPLSEILRVERARRDLGMVEASKAIGINKETLARLEKGLGNAYYPTIKRIAEFYKLPIQDLLVASAPVDADEEEGEDEAPKVAAPTWSEPGEDTERRVAELERWIEYIERRARAWEQQAAVEENPFLSEWQIALQWESEVLQEAFDLRESVEEVAQSLMPDGKAYGEAAEAVLMLEDSYRRISAAIQQVTGRALEATARAKKEAMDSALNEVIDQINEEERRIKEQSEATRALFTPV